MSNRSLLNKTQVSAQYKHAFAWFTAVLIASNLVYRTAIGAPQSQAKPEIRLAPGDDRTGYETAEYETNSLSLELRTGKPANLFAIATSPQLGLPPVVFPKDNKPDRLKIQLGKKLFFDRRLSRNRTMSCAMCHIPEQGFTSNELRRPIGFEGRSVKRNAPTILNVGYMKRLFADARETTLEQQVWSPLLAPNEMNNPSVGFVIDTILNDPNYERLFKEAFSAPPNMLNVGQALAQYQRSLISGNSRFDQWFYGKQQDALNKDEIAGFNLFIGKAKCAKCHQITKTNALFTDNKLHNTGVGYRFSMLKPSETVEVQIAPGVTTKLDRKVIDSVGVPKPNDLGRYEVTLDPSDRWKYRTPSLRNVALTAPYMHNGEFKTLREVVEYYNRGGEAHSLQSNQVKSLGLNDTELNSLVVFLATLTGGKVEVFVSDAYFVPLKGGYR